LGAFVRGQIERQREQSNPIGFSFPDASKGRVWLASPKDGSKITGDDCLWRVNIEELRRQEQHKRPVIQWRPTAEALRRPIIVVGRNDPVRDVDEALQTLKGFRERAPGSRLWVTCQFRGNKVSLHHNGNVATMKRKAFSELLAAVRVARPKRRRPSLRLVVSNPTPSVANAVAA
jgi:hypothetical protein